MFDGMMARPRATSSRTNSGVTKSGTARAKTLAVVVGGLRHVEHLLAAEIFALGDINHFLGDDAQARPLQLSDGLAVERAQRPRRVGEIARQMLARHIAVVDRLDRAAFILFDAAALLHPIEMRARFRPFSTSIAASLSV